MTEMVGFFDHFFAIGKISSEEHYTMDNLIYIGVGLK
jgi:hypothetical protein